MMNDKEINEASLALMAWFMSQEINHGEACLVMSRVIATVLVNLPMTKQRLTIAIKDFNNVLHCDIELFVGMLPEKDDEK
jgi:K+-sensing histidine kinase KdpD